MHMQELHKLLLNSIRVESLYPLLPLCLFLHHSLLFPGLVTSLKRRRSHPSLYRVENAGPECSSGRRFPLLMPPELLTSFQD